MHPGLLRILDLIRVNPQDSLLVDRFLILAADLTEPLRVDATLGLSEALLRKNPRRAIELAHMVFKARPGEPQPIELMVEGLENLGRYGKATVLRAQLEKVRKARETNPGKVKETADDSIVLIDQELQFLLAEQAAAKAAAEAAKAASEAVPSLSLDAPESTVLLSVEQGLPTENDRGDVAVKSGLQRTSVARSESLEEQNFGVPLATPEVRGTQFSVAPSLRPNSQIADGVPQMREREMGLAPMDMVAEPGIPPPPPPRVHAFTDAGIPDELAIERLRVLIAAKSWDSAWLWVETHWPRADHVGVLAVFKELGLARIDLRFMGWWLDALAFDHRPRYALISAIDLVRQQPHMAIARMVIERVPRLLKTLNLTPVEWVEEEGVLALVRKLDLHKLQTPASLAILAVRRSA